MTVTITGTVYSEEPPEDQPPPTPDPTPDPPPTPSPVMNLSASYIYKDYIKGMSCPYPIGAVTVTNSSGGSISWTASESSPYIHVYPTSGNQSGSFNISLINCAGLNVGTTLTVDITVTGTSSQTVLNSPAVVRVQVPIKAPGYIPGK